MSDLERAIGGITGLALAINTVTSLGILIGLYLLRDRRP
jgi:hypothetical protein